ncbi:MAG: helix-turn-helix transcriptional regulator [Treponema sp.]|uniref:helix-turn-helix domain-containing protein n=1 Tax=Treponema sp. TaxID=166 RepID=UPI0025F5218E|nr:helix-turn-helix transcriptional regulator [Treponema sp.]MBQ8679335.1 helix-turn-helix transcriptional regulator [Treponema sp.]MBQ8681267.1 helix-turn-helix transcriptional regulator [Treponema sp.]
MGFWQNVDNECEYRGISRKELANIAHFSVNTISSGIKRNGMPEADLAVRISKVLDIPLEKLLGIENEISAIDKSNFESQQKLFSAYLPYIKKMEKMPAPMRKSIFMLIENIPVQS